MGARLKSAICVIISLYSKLLIGHPLRGHHDPPIPRHRHRRPGRPGGRRRGCLSKDEGYYKGDSYGKTISSYGEPSHEKYDDEYGYEEHGYDHKKSYKTYGPTFRYKRSVDERESLKATVAEQMSVLQTWL